jgi:hypothetical protein
MMHSDATNTVSNLSTRQFLPISPEFIDSAFRYHREIIEHGHAKELMAAKQDRIIEKKEMLEKLTQRRRELEILHTQAEERRAETNKETTELTKLAFILVDANMHNQPLLQETMLKCRRTASEAQEDGVDVEQMVGDLKTNGK